MLSWGCSKIYVELQSLDVYLGTEFIQSMKKAVWKQWLYLIFLHYLRKWLLAIFVNCWFIIWNTVDTWQEAIWLTQGANGYICGASLFFKMWNVLLLLTIIYMFLLLKNQGQWFLLVMRGHFLNPSSAGPSFTGVQKCPVCFLKLNAPLCPG
jgi:hypothetical protein